MLQYNKIIWYTVSRNVAVEFDSRGVWVYAYFAIEPIIQHGLFTPAAVLN